MRISSACVHSGQVSRRGRLRPRLVGARAAPAMLATKPVARCLGEIAAMLRIRVPGHRIAAAGPACSSPLPATPPQNRRAGHRGRPLFASIGCDDGYLRLDQRTGQVSLCSRAVVGWACQPVPDERTALEERDRAAADGQCGAEEGTAGARPAAARHDGRSDRRRARRDEPEPASCRAMPSIDRAHGASWRRSGAGWSR